MNGLSTVPCQQEEINRIIDEAESILVDVALNDQRHPTFVYLQFKENPLFRKEILRKIAYDIPTYVKVGGDYAIKRHARSFLNTLGSVSRRTQAVLIGQLETDHLREFLLACMIIIHSLLPEYQKLIVDVRDLIPQFHSRPEFQAMTFDEWKTSAKFRNYLAISLQFISPAHNKVKMINSAAMLCGINNCLQGGGRTTQARRLYSIFDHVAASKELPSKRHLVPPSNEVPETDANSFIGNEIFNSTQPDTPVKTLNAAVHLKHTALFSGMKFENTGVGPHEDPSLGANGQCMETGMLFNPVVGMVGAGKVAKRIRTVDGENKQPRKRKPKSNSSGEGPEMRMQEEQDAVQALLFLTNPAQSSDSPSSPVGQ